MAEGTRFTQLSDAVKQLQEVTTILQEEQSKHGLLMEGILQQLNNMAASYDNRRSSGEGTSQNTRVHANPLLEGNGGIQARSLRLEFPRYDGGDPSEWILKA